MIKKLENERKNTSSPAGRKKRGNEKRTPGTGTPETIKKQQDLEQERQENQKGRWQKKGIDPLILYEEIFQRIQNRE